MSFYAMDYDVVIGTAHKMFLDNGYSQQDADTAVWGISSWISACLPQNAYLEGEWLQPAELVVVVDVWGSVDKQIQDAKNRLSECVEYAKKQLVSFALLKALSDECVVYLPVEEEEESNQNNDWFAPSFMAV